MQNAELIQFDHGLKKTAPFCELCLPQTSVCSGETLHREHGERDGARRNPQLDRVMSDAYGHRLGERLRVENAPAIVSRALRTADIAVTEIRCDNPSSEMSGSIQQEDAFLVALLLRDFPHHEYWEDGRRAPVCDLRAGEIIFWDLKRDRPVSSTSPITLWVFICRVRRWTRSPTTPMRRALVTLAIGPRPARAWPM
jgi:hypothetical protein